MGLMDVLNGMMNGPRGQINPSSAGTSGGMSPITMGLLALLAYKALKPSGAGGSAGESAQPVPSGPSAASGSDWQSSLSHLIAGGGAGTILSGGLGELLRRFEQTGHGGLAQSWVGNGPNQPVTPVDLERAIDPDTLMSLARQTGMSREQLLAALAQQLPQAVDHLTPQGRIPTHDEAGRWM